MSVILCRVRAGGAQGWGYFVSETRVATSAAVVGAEADVRVDMEGTEYRALVEYADWRSDSALVTLQAAAQVPVPPLRLVSVPPRWGLVRCPVREDLEFVVMRRSAEPALDGYAAVLFSDALVQGDFDPTYSLAGAPVVSDGAVLGQLRAPPAEDNVLGPESLGLALMSDVSALVPRLEGGGPSFEEVPVIGLRPGAVLQRAIARFMGQVERLGHRGWTFGTGEALMGVVEAWTSLGLADEPGPLLPAAEIFVGLNQPERAVEALRRAGNSKAVQQLRGRALARLGQTDQAIAILQNLYLRNPEDSETAGILAGIYRRNPDAASHVQARKIYRANWVVTGSTYTGINAAAMALMLGDEVEAFEITQAVLDLLQRQPESERTFWDWATLGEAYLILKDLDASKLHYRKAYEINPHRIHDLGTILSRVREHLSHHGLDADLLNDVLLIPPVVAYAGHMTDPDPLEGQPERFPREHMGQVRQSIADVLGDLGKVHAVGSAARGADLLFLSEVLEQGGTAQVILPFKRSHFEQLSVGERDLPEFRRLVSHPRVELIDPGIDAPEGAEAREKRYEQVSRQIYQDADEFAKGLGQEPRPIVVWDRKKAGYGRFGTAFAVAVWGEELNQPPQIIDLPPVRRNAPAPRWPWGVVATAALLLVGLVVHLFQARYEEPVELADVKSPTLEEVRQAGLAGSRGLFVGVQTFGKGSGIAPIEYAVDDAVDLAYVFAVQLGLLSPDRVVMLKSGEPRKRVSRERLQRLVAAGADVRPATRPDILEAMGAAARDTTQAGTLMFFIATHGFTLADEAEAKDAVYVLPSDARASLKVKSALQLKDLLAPLEEAEAGKKLVFVDACRRVIEKARDSTDDAEARVSDAFWTQFSEARGTAYLLSSKVGGYAFDDPFTKNGVFTRGLLNGLRSAETSTAGIVTLKHLTDYVNLHVIQWVKKHRPLKNKDKSLGIAKYLSPGAADIPLSYVSSQRPRPKPLTFGGRCPPGVVGDCTGIKDRVLHRLAGLSSVFPGENIYVVEPSGGRRDGEGRSTHNQGLAVDVQIEGKTTDEIGRALSAEGFLGIGYYYKANGEGYEMAHGDLRGVVEAKGPYAPGKKYGWPGCWRSYMTPVRPVRPGYFKLSYITRKGKKFHACPKDRVPPHRTDVARSLGSAAEGFEGPATLADIEAFEAGEFAE